MLNATLDGRIGTPDLLANPIHIRIPMEDNLPTKNKMIEQAWTRHGERYLDRNCDTMFVSDDSGLARAVSSLVLASFQNKTLTADASSRRYDLIPLLWNSLMIMVKK